MSVVMIIIITTMVGLVLAWRGASFVKVEICLAPNSAKRKTFQIRNPSMWIFSTSCQPWEFLRVQADWTKGCWVLSIGWTEASGYSHLLWRSICFQLFAVNSLKYLSNFLLVFEALKWVASSHLEMDLKSLLKPEPGFEGPQKRSVKL